VKESVGFSVYVFWTEENQSTHFPDVAD